MVTLLGVALAAFAVLGVTQVDLGAAGSALAGADPELLAASVALYAVGQSISGAMWAVCQGAGGVRRLPLSTALGMHWITRAACELLPASLGEAARIALVRRHPAGPEEEETMTSVREGIEQAVLLSIGAASLTRERAEAAVAELVRKGQVGGDEGKVIVDRLMARVRGEGGAGTAAGLVGRLEGGVQGVLREFGVVTRAELEEVQLRLMELEHRISLLEKAPPGDPPGAPETP